MTSQIEKLKSSASLDSFNSHPFLDKLILYNAKMFRNQYDSDVTVFSPQV
jgi:hypothetical protein